MSSGPRPTGLTGSRARMLGVRTAPCTLGSRPPRSVAFARTRRTCCVWPPGTSWGERSVVPTVPSASRPADHRITAIIAAMPEEVAPLRARLIGARRLSLRGGTGAAEVVLGHLGGVAVALAVTGDGARNAREGIAALLGHVEVNRLIALGVAGALSPDLGEGALVVAEQVMLEGGAPDTTL